ncbi:MAG: PQQ-binding-like beta-propeller repeat protein [Pyrinomonadaceae bacterium]
MKPEQITRRKRSFAITGLLILMAILSSGCGRPVGTVTSDGVEAGRSAPKPPPALPQLVKTWLGNWERNFYGTGPIPDKPLKVIWQIKTGYISGRLHPDGWGGTSWPGQPTVTRDTVYYPSADGNVYSVNVKDGTINWKSKATDSFKAAPTILGDRIIASGLDHIIYCIDRNDGSLIWKFTAGFEIDGSVMEKDGRIYFGCEDSNFYALNLSDGSLVYKIQLGGSMEGSGTAVDGRIYVGTERGQLYCLNQVDGKIIWQAPIGNGADSDSTPAVHGDFVYTAAEDGYVRCFRKDNGQEVWKWKSDPGGSESGGRGGFWASPIVWENNIFLGSDNGNFYKLTMDGQMVWKTRMHMAVWGTSPIVDGKIIVGDKAGWVNILDPKDGRILTEIKIGDSVNATPAVLNGRIYIGAFMGQLYCLGFED